jgi:polar amino acid transport system permease protein
MSVGAGERRPQRTSGDRAERLAQASAGVPFKWKVATVWAAIFAALAFFFGIAGFDTEWMLDKAPFIIGGLRYTLLIALGGIFLAIVLALVGALGRLSSNPVAFGIAGFYTSFFRGTPLIVQMFLIYLALPQVGQNLNARFPGFPDAVAAALILDAAVAGILALGLNYGAYMTEIFRAGIQSVGGGQSEAAEALGMTYRQRMRRVVLPQAFRVIVPPTGNEFIAMMKDTALVSFLGTTAATAEIFRRSQLVGKADFRPLEASLVAAGIYWGLTAIFTFFQMRLERRLSKGYDRSVAGATKPPRFLPTGGAGGTGGGGGTVQIPSPEDSR